MVNTRRDPWLSYHLLMVKVPSENLEECWLLTDHGYPWGLSWPLVLLIRPANPFACCWAPCRRGQTMGTLSRYVGGCRACAPVFGAWRSVASRFSQMETLFFGGHGMGVMGANDAFYFSDF